MEKQEKPKQYQFATFREKETNQTHLAYYIPAADIVSVELKGAVEGSKKVKPLNGYWVKSSAIPNPQVAKKEVLSFKEFSQKKPDIKSPFVGEENETYKAIYDKLNDKFLYFKNGRRNSTKISLKKAYDTYLYDEGQKMETGGNIEELNTGMIIVFKDEYGDLHNGKIVKKSIGDSFNVKDISSNKVFLVSKSQIVD